MAIRSGLSRAARTGWFLTKVIVPLSAAVAVLDWTGTLGWIGRQLAPVMGIFGLPGEAALPIVTGWFTGVYGALGAASAVTLTTVQMTVMGLMVLVAHNLILESAVQSRSGTSGPMVTLVRIATGAVLGFLAWQVLRVLDPNAGLALHGAASTKAETLGAFTLAWAVDTAMLLLKVYLILVALMILVDLMRAYAVFEKLERPVRPLMRFLGLSERVTFLWLTGTFLGISYGAGLIVEEAKEAGRFEPGDLRDLHVSLGICHSPLEDTLLLVALGANPIWLVLPRPFAAAAVVRAVRGIVPARPVAAAQPAEGTP